MPQHVLAELASDIVSKSKNPDQASSSEKDLLSVASEPEQDPSSLVDDEDSPKPSVAEDSVSEASSSTPSPAILNETEETNSSSKKDSAPKAKASKHAKSDNAQANKKSGLLSAIAVLFLVAILAATGGAGYLTWQQVQLERQRIAELENKINQQSQQQTQQFSNISNALLSVENKIQQQSQDFSGVDQRAQQLESYLERQLQGYREQLLTLSTTSNDDWKLAEAYYLTRLATQRLQMEKSTVGALALLQAADDIVKTQKDPELYRVREALADDITALQLAGAIDREGIYLQLAAIIKQLDRLPNSMPENFQDIKENTDMITDSDDSSSDGAIKNSFKRLLGHLQSYFRVRHIENNGDNSIPVQSNEIAKIRLNILLESAQLALLREQSEIYKDSLTKAKELVTVNFSVADANPNDNQAEKLSFLIDQMLAESIEQTIPDIQQSQIVLGDYLEKLHKINSNRSNIENSTVDSQAQTVTQ